MNDKPWLDENSMANIISFLELVKQYRVTYDTEQKDCFYCHTEDGIVEFERTEEGLYCVSLPEGYKEQVRQNDVLTTKHSYVSSVTENRANYTTAEFERGK